MPMMLLSLLLGLAVSCGSLKKDKKTTESPAAPIPHDWDGASDWPGSPFKIVDEP